MTILLSLLMLLQAAPARDLSRKEITALQSEVDAVASPVVARMEQHPKATYLDGYGFVVTLEVALVTPPNLFSTPVSPADLKASVAKRRKDLADKLQAFLKERVAKMDFIEPAESLAIVVYITNYTPADVPNIPIQMLFTVKKELPEQVFSREF
jgi:hypothetical protein